MIIIWGPKQTECFMENEKNLNSVLKRRSEDIDYAGVVYV